MRGREREIKVIRALAFEAGLWGIGSQQDVFDYRDFGLEKVIALHMRDIVEAVRAALKLEEPATEDAAC